MSGSTVQRSNLLAEDDVAERARRVRLVLLDVDGVLTDGTVSIGGGSESKSFSIRDGLGIALARREGLEVGLLSGRPSDATMRRAAELRLRIVHQGNPDKRTVYTDLLATHGYQDDEVAYMADDVLDLPVLKRVGLSAAPADAADEVLAEVHWISRLAGGRGAVRELIELVLRAQGRWDNILKDYLT